MHRLRSLVLLLALGCDADLPADAPRRPPAAASNDEAAAPPAAAARPPGGSVPEPAVVSYAASSPGLRGYLYRPAGDGPFPAVVYNHGSERDPSDFRGQARFFVPRGFILMVPHRRGHGLSSDVAPYPDALDSIDAPPGALVATLDAELEDVVAAVRYTRALDGVDPDRIAVIGCSLGGVESLLLATREPEVRVAVDFAGGSIAWAHDPALRARMTSAAESAQIPVLFVQAANDYDTTPSRVLYETIRARGRPAQLAIFPPHGEGPRGGHTFCAGGADPGWGETVLAFIEQTR